MKIGLVSGDWVHPSRTPDGKERWGGSGWARVAQYAEHLPYDFVTGTLVWNRDHFVVRDAEDNYHWVNLIFMHRLMHVGLAQNIPAARAMGQVIINDIDDWYWGLDPSNNAFKASHPKHNSVENTNAYRSILANSDLVIVSTPYLASRLTWVRNGITVVKNTVDVSRFHAVEQTDSDVPVVGWAGSTAHRSGDLETIAGVLRPMMRRGEIKLHHSGHHDSQPSFASRLLLKDSEVSTLPLSGHDEYPSILTMEVGIVPLRVTPFNQAKSDIKGMEYAASSIPFVAQRIDAYQELYDSLGIGRLADKPVDWVKHLRALRDPSVRREEGAKYRELVEARDIRYGVEALREILDSFR